MKNKYFLLTVIISFSFIVTSVFFNIFNMEIRSNDFEKKQTIKVFEKYKNKKYSFCYGNRFYCSNVNYKLVGKVNTNKTGVYDVKYIIKYKKHKFIKIKKVKVVDDIKPKIIIDGKIESVCPSGKIDGITIKAVDNYDGNLSDKINYKVTNNSIIFSVKDNSNNEQIREEKAKIVDSIAPSLILNGDKTIYLSVGSKFIDPGYTAIDNCDDDITNKVYKEGNVDINNPGNYEITYNVLDSNFNKTIERRSVKVFEKNNYSPENISSKTIYLTFDDGPGPYTQRLLDILNKYNVKATFFVVGYNNYGYLMKQEAQDGHTVALHSQTHNYSYIYSSVDAYMQDLLAIQAKVKQETKIDSKIIRFPGGSSNTISRNYKIGIMSELTKKVEELGYRYFDWTISSGDAGETTSSDKVYQNVVNNIKENSTNVVLMHDIKSYTVDSIERIIIWGLSNGYTFAPLTVNSPVVHQKVNN